MEDNSGVVSFGPGTGDRAEDQTEIYHDGVYEQNFNVEDHNVGDQNTTDKTEKVFSMLERQNICSEPKFRKIF